ncbi:glycoside hydrolase family 79 protein [Trichoderma cornu-damae]|uniref:Glycoside hydrolase family 79 protein n=1 Tax=Trichoderma cornu-damae TaxID=654480 RepID=A0A9P8QUK6_9HYPO|nr:glycoside hydrolase family 79 protein [Trichoderma cornu-damae]
MAKYLVPASLLLLAQSIVAASLFDSYVSLSFELIGFPTFAGTRSHPNSFSRNLIHNLAELQGSGIVVRVGGNSGDRAIYDSTLATATASACPNADPGAWQCIGTTFFESYGGFPAGTRYSHQFNLGAYNSSGWNTLQNTVPLACKALVGQLEYWEVGNEPDLFIGSRRPSTYNASQYSTEWLNTTEHFESHLRRACPQLSHSIKYIAPSLSSPGARLHIGDIFQDEGNATQKIIQVSVHNYMNGATVPGVTLQSTLMSHNAVVESIAGHINYAKTSEINADYIIGEHNSLYGGGASGLSDVFGAALWAMEFSLYAASTDVIKRIHFHQSVGSPYAAWVPSGTLATKAPYYGKLAASAFLAHSNTIDIHTIALNKDADKDSGYGAYINGDLQRVAVLNLRQYNSGSGARGNQTYSVTVAPGSSWTSKRLTAPGATDTTGVTFNGFSYDADSNGLAKRVSGKESGKIIRADHSGNITFTLQDSEAIVLLRNYMR